MSNSIEIEKKALVKESEYNKFLKYFGVNEKDSYSQTNYYIDTKDFSLNQEGFALRIRHTKEEFLMTLKAPLNEGVLEKSQPLTKQQFEKFKTKNIFPDGYIKSFLPLVDINPDELRIITFLNTKRIDIPFKKGLLSIDKNTYSGKTDYEIELEYDSEIGASKELEDIFNKLKVKYIENKKSKTLRALLSLNNK